MARALPAGAIEAIVEGRHGDPFAVLGPIDDRLVGEGTHGKLYDHLGAHALDHEGTA